ncbi:hypothetical protein QEN19_004130 [Hanseniaspora menglaensis]
MTNSNQIQLIFLRHGQSTLNSKNLFCGWIDPPLTEVGVEQAKTAAFEIQKHLQKKNHADLPSVSFCSRLTRTKQTLVTILEELTRLNGKPENSFNEKVIIEKHHPLEFSDISVNSVKNNTEYNFYQSWRLNERHYGSWQGKNKKKIQQIVGDKEYMRVRRDYEGKPPDVNLFKEMEQQNREQQDDVNLCEERNLHCNNYCEEDGKEEYEFKEPNRALKYNIEYQFGDVELPISESLSNVLARITPLLSDYIIPKVVQSENKTGLVIAHGSSIRAILMILCGLDENEIKNVDIPNGMPMVLELEIKEPQQQRNISADNKIYDLTLLDRYYLDPETAKKKAELVRMEGRH